MTRKLNTGGLAALVMTLVSLDAVYRYPDSTEAFHWFAVGCMAFFGGLAWISFNKFGMWIHRRVR